MKKELRILIYSMINNLIIAIIKIAGGIVFGINSLFADGLHTFSDFIINIVSAVGAKLSRKRPTKHHPYGFGRVEYLTNIFVGMMLAIIGGYIFIHSFNMEREIPSLDVLWVLGISIILKAICIIIMYKGSKKAKSKILLTSAKESMADIYSSIGVILITLIMQLSDENPILKNTDFVGTILISILIFDSAFRIVWKNSLAIIGEVEDDEIKITKVKEFLKENFKEIKDEELYLVKFGAYYRLHLTIEVDKNISVGKVLKLERKIEKSLVARRSFSIKSVDISISNEIGK